MALDIDRLLAEVSPDEPCGPDLSYDTAYFELMRAAEGTPAQQIGDSVKEGEEPDWRDVKSRAIELLARSKDLNVVMTLLAAMVHNDGMTGLADGLGLLKALLERHWDGFHPRIDPDEKDDPFLERMNIVASLAAAPGATGDIRKYQANIRLAPLCKSRQLGSFSFRDVLIARGDMPAPSSMPAPPTMGVIEGAFAETESSDLLAFGQAASTANTLAQEIDQWVTAKVGAHNAPDLASLLDLLKQIDRFMQEQLAKRGYGAAPTEAVADQASGDPGSGGGGANDPIRGSVRGTGDVIMLIGKICEYYQKYEPSSPVPILLRRAERLVGKSFVDAVRDLSPDALSQLKMVAGVETFNEY
ncbi:MAG: type VI secretion system protein TssA [Phycisphaeraceae bacterium]|nr:type VI secretion system protein TssA [Phycisphaeraceae bacterium]MCW5763377.1 type VI secretion system protein TssA [Phycisphaeraceae bacterium]